MALRLKTEYIVVVARNPKPPFGFRWDIRQFNFGVSLERATRSYASEAQARQAGEEAAALLRRAVQRD